MKALNYGYVKVLCGTCEGRIGRYVSQDAQSGKAKVYFGYHMDALRFENYRHYKKLAKSSLTNAITKRDLVDRYFALVQTLESIDLNGNRSIKKYSAEHMELITECNIVRGLSRETFSPALLDPWDAQNNVLLLACFKDAIWVNDFALGLEERRFTVALDDHETWSANRMDLFRASLDACRTYIFVLSKHAQSCGWFKEEFLTMQRVANTPAHNVVCVKADDVRTPAYVGMAYDLSDQFSAQYDRNFERLVEGIRQEDGA